MRTAFGGIKLNGKMQGNIHTLAAVMVQRAMLAATLGKSFGGKRDLYSTCGYPLTIEFRQFYARYVRQDIASRIVNAFPEATWRSKPEIYDDEEADETKFEKAWKKMVKKAKLYHYLARVDKLAGIGRYAVLLLGFNDANSSDLSTPVEKATELLYLQPYSEENATIVEWVTDTTDERYGQPLYYNVTLLNGDGSSLGSKRVHYSRILHVADNVLESDIFGIPRLEKVYNRLQDLECILAGASEMFWRGGFPGMSLEADSDTEIDDPSATDMQDEVEKYVHGLTRYMRLKGVQAKVLSPSVADPTNHVKIEIQMISAATGIPARILLGTEEAKLAGQQDTDSWDDRVDERRKDFAQLRVIDPLVERLIGVGVLPEPADGEYTVEWADIHALSDKEVIDIALQETTAITKYADSPNAASLMPPDLFFMNVMGYTQDEVDAISKAAEQQAVEDEDQAAKDAELMAAMNPPAPVQPGAGIQTPKSSVIPPRAPKTPKQKAA